MKKLLLFSLLSLSLVSCSSMKDKFGDVKIDIAKEAKEFTTKELKESFESADLSIVDGFSCESEAEEIGLNVETELLKFLKAEQKVAAMADKSLTSEVLSDVCVYVNEKAVPLLVEKIPTKYVCLRKLGAGKAVELGKDLCGLIK